jgi:hypothetical protein
MKFHLLIPFLSLISINSYGFDLEDYATTYRATRDAYLKAANEFVLAKAPMDQMNAMMHRLEAACYKVNWGPENRPSGMQGLMSGACNVDGELPDPLRGPKLKDGSIKFGTQFATLINLAPLTSNFPYHDSQDSATQYRAARDHVSKYRNELFLANHQTPWHLTSIPNCVVKDQAFRDFVESNRNSTSMNWFDDTMTTYRAVRDAFFKAANELALATGPYQASKDAYEAAAMVFTTVSDCEDNLGRENPDYYDPYDWQ